MSVPPQPPPARQTNGWGIAGLVLGIAIWTVGWLLLLFPPVQLAIVIVGIVASALGLRNSRRVDEEGQSLCGGRGMSITGLTMNCIAAPGVLIWMLVFLIGETNGS